MKKTLIFFGMILLMTGCYNQKLKANYNHMQIGKDGINSYILDLRIYGTTIDSNINEFVRISNYKNMDFKIENNSNRVKDENNALASIIYVLKGKTYTKGLDGIYNLTHETVNYNNPSVYLDGLKNIISIGKKKITTINKNKYDTYDAVFDKAIVSNLIKDTSLKDLTVTKNINGKIYLDSKGYVYRIIYNINDIVINANYFGINTVRKIELPN